MSILSALKARGAKGKNIEEAVKTLPIGGESGGGILVVGATYDEQTDVTTLDKTWQEIYDAPVAFIESDDSLGKSLILVETVYVESGEYKVNDYTAESANDYPSSGGGR